MLSTICVRRFTWNFTDSPKYWANGSPALSHLLNAYTALVPDNEKYYIRVLTACNERITEADVKRALMDFCRQEALHGLAHQKHWERLRSQNVPIEAYVSRVNALLYGFLERYQPRRLQVAIVAAIEHLNASWAHSFLKLNVLKNADPELSALFSWHFAEEIEHKSVAFDVLSSVYPGYATRLLGAILTFPLFYLLVFGGAALFASKERSERGYSMWADVRRNVVSTRLARALLQETFRYMRPGFRPSEVDDYDLAKDALKTLAIRKRPSATVQPDARANA